MDILNFLSWIKAKRLLKSAPQNSLLPIGVLDNRRGDKYQTYAIAPGDLGIGVITLDSYTELYDLLISESLVPGAKYRFPYRNVNFLNGYYVADNNIPLSIPGYDAREIFVGEEEMLVVEAISNSELAPTAYSETYPQDVIEYLPYANKTGINLYVGNNTTLPNGSTVTNFNLQWDGTNVYFNMPADYPAYYGHYFYIYCAFDGYSYYQDGCYEPLLPNGYCQYPFSNDYPFYSYPKQLSRIRLENGGYKVVLLDLTYNDYLEYVPNSLGIETIRALGDAYGCILRRYDPTTQIDVTFDFRSRTHRRYEANYSSYVSDLGTGYWGIPGYIPSGQETGNYLDFLSIPFKSYECYDIVIKGTGGMDGNEWYAGQIDNNVFLGKVYNFTANGTMMNNTIGDDCRSNTVPTSFQGNTINFGFYFNTIEGEGFLGNFIARYFIDNKISRFFQGNKIDRDFMHNTIGAEFSTNTIGESFSFNTIANKFRNMIISFGFSRNTIPTEFSFNTNIGPFFRRNVFLETVLYTNFSAATHVYGLYDCTIFKRSDGSSQLSYVDGSNVVQYTAVTA